MIISLSPLCLCESAEEGKDLGEQISEEEIIAEEEDEDGSDYSDDDSDSSDSHKDWDFRIKQNHPRHCRLHQYWALPQEKRNPMFFTFTNRNPIFSI